MSLWSKSTYTYFLTAPNSSHREGPGLWDGGRAGAPTPSFPQAQSTESRKLMVI